MQKNIKAKTGNRVIVTYDGSQVGACQSVSMNDDLSPEPVSGIGDIHALEYVPTMARHTVNVEEMILDSATLRSLGAAIQNGDAALQGMVFDILVMSKDDGSLLRKYSGCSYASGSVEVRKHAIVTGHAVFNALDVSGSGA
jgi:hypothetical protein